MVSARQLKIAAAEKALDFVVHGMRLGIGTGSTAEEFIKLLSERVKQGLVITGVATSERSAELCRELGIAVASPDQEPELDLTIDGADEIGPGLTLIKGGGGALLREKIVASASKEMLVIAEEGKIVRNLGAFALPVEVNAFGVEATRRAVKKMAMSLGLSGEVILRTKNGLPYITDGGHFILDASLGSISDPEEVSRRLLAIPGVVEHGLFLKIASRAVIACNNGSIRLIDAKTFQGV